MSVVVTAVFVVALLPWATYFGIAVYMSLAPCYDKLSGPSFVEFFQKTDPYMKVRAPMLGLAQLVLTLSVLGLLWEQWATAPFWLTAVALLLGVISTVIAVRGNVPLNRQMEQWSSASPPAGWEKVRDRWLRLHSLRGLAQVVGFVLLLIAALCWRPIPNAANQPTEPRSKAESTLPIPRCLEATVYLPLADNDGRAFPDSHWQAVLEALVVPFGGATLGESQEGCWVDARGRFRREPIRPVIISFAPARLEEFRKVVHEVGKKLGQEFMYVRFEESRVEFIYGNRTLTVAK